MPIVCLKGPSNDAIYMPTEGLEADPEVPQKLLANQSFQQLRDGGQVGNRLLITALGRRLRDRGRKLYPNPGAGTGTSEADPSSSRVSMDWFDRTVIYNNLSLINFYGEVFYYYYCQGDE